MLYSRYNHHATSTIWTCMVLLNVTCDMTLLLLSTHESCCSWHYSNWWNHEWIFKLHIDSVRLDAKLITYNLTGASSLSSVRSREVVPSYKITNVLTQLLHGAGHHHINHKQSLYTLCSSDAESPCLRWVYDIIPCAYDIIPCACNLIPFAPT